MDSEVGSEHRFVLYLKIYLFERLSKRKEERKIFHLLVHSPEGPNSQARPGRTQNFIQVSHIGADDQELGPFSVLSQAHQ